MEALHLNKVYIIRSAYDHSPLFMEYDGRIQPYSLFALQSLQDHGYYVVDDYKDNGLDIIDPSEM